MLSLSNTLAAAGFVPARLESAMLAAVRAAGASAWYVADDYLTLGPELVVVNTASVAGASVYFYSDFVPVVGKSYQITYQYSVTGGTSVQMSLGGSSVPSSTVGSGTVVYTITATNTTPLRCYSNAATATLSGISVKEVLSAKDFQDSVGTLPTYLGGTVGMMFDTAGVTGPELIANPHTSAIWVAEGTTPPTAVNGADSYLGKACRSVTFPVIASGGYGVCRARDAESIFNVVTGTTYSVSFEYALSRDLTTGESVAIAVTGSSGLYAKSVSAGAPGGVWCSGSGGQPAVASGGGTALRPYATMLNSPLTVYIRALSVKVSGGVVAVQSTAGNRPTISRMPRKLGPELVVNGNFDTDSSNWTAGVATIAQSSGELQVTSTGAVYGYARQIIPVEVGKTYQIKGKGRLGTANLARILAGNSTDALAYTGANLTIQSTTQVIRSMAFVANDTSLVITLENNNTITNATSFFDEISVREVLEWSYALTFDGSNDSVATPASVIGATLAQPYTMIQAFRAGQVGVGQRIQGDTGRWAAIGSTNKLVVTHQGSTFVAGVSDTVLGELLISEVTWDGTTAKIWKNGVLDGQGALAAPSGVTPSAHNIGQNGGNAAYFKGDLVYSCVCPAVMTDAQRLAVRKFAAAQMGLTL